MNKNLSKILKILLFTVCAYSIFIFTACDQVEDVTLDTGLQSIAVTHLPNKIKYSRTDTVLDTTGLIVTATYRTGSTKVIPNSELTFSGFRESEGYYTSSEQIIITYKDGSNQARFCNYTITYSDIASITIASQPNRTRYTQNTPLDLNGILINATYQDNSVQPVFSASILELLYLTEFADGETIVSSEEYNKAKSYCGRDGYGNAVSLTIPLDYKRDENNKFVKDENGNRILTKKIEFSGFDDTAAALTESSQVVTVKYTEIADGYFMKEADAQFQIKLAKLTGLSVALTPDKTHYTTNSVLNFDGINVKASYSDGSSETIFSKEIYDNLTTITATKKAEIENFIGGTGKTLTIPLEWKTDNNGNFIYRGGEPVAARSIVFSGFDSTAGVSSQEVKIKYIDNWGTEAVEVSKDTQASEAKFGIVYETIQSINITSEPTKYKYKRGEFFDFSGLIVKATYSNYKTEILFSDAVFENLDTLSPLEKMKVQSYTGGDVDAAGKQIPLVIPLEWKRKADGTIETDPETRKNVPLRELIITNFDSTKIISSEQVTITLKDYSVNPVNECSQKFAVSFIDIAAVQLSTNPTKLRYFQNEPLDLSGIVLNAQYEDNSMSTVFSDDIFTALATLTSTEKDKVKAFTGKQSGTDPDYDKDSFGRKWYKQLESKQDNSNTLTIPLEWKKNYWGQYVDKDGSVIADQTDVSERVCVKGFTIIGFNSSVTTSSQTVRIRYAEKTDYGTFIREVSFNVTYKILSSIQISSLPNNANLGNKKDNPISFEGINVTAQYTDNTSETVFSKAIYDALPSAYKTAIEPLGTNYSVTPLSITLQKNGTETIRKIEFSGYNSTGTPPAQQKVTVKYYEGTDNKETYYYVNYNGLQSIQITQQPATNYVMNADSATGTVGGIGRIGVNRSASNEILKDISNWHFNADGMKITLNYNNSPSKTITFENINSTHCYGEGRLCGYVVENSKLLYMQRWGKDETGKQYKIKIEGFDPIAVFTTSNQRSGSQVLTISYTEDETTVSTQLQINYDFTPSYKFHTEPKNVNGDYKYVLFGDYPQFKLIGDVKINKYKEQHGLYKYQVGSDGNYYCEKTIRDETSYYMVTALEWNRIGNEDDGYYIAEKVIDDGVPYYSGKSGRKNTKQVSVVTGNQHNSDIIDFNVIYTYNISDASFIYSTVRNWLNGDNINGDSTYNGKGFLQTAFGDSLTKLKDIAVTEYFNTDVTISRLSDAYSKKNLTYEETASVKVILPSDYVKPSKNDDGETIRSVKRTFVNTGDVAMLEDAFKWPSTKDQSFYNDCNASIEFKPNGITTMRTSRFADRVSSYWLASDICNLNTSEPDKNYPARYLVNWNQDSETRHTTEKLTDSLYTVGIVPIIKLGKF